MSHETITIDGKLNDHKSKIDKLSEQINELCKKRGELILQRCDMLTKRDENRPLLSLEELAGKDRELSDSFVKKCYKMVEVNFGLRRAGVWTATNQPCYEFSLRSCFEPEFDTSKILKGLERLKKVVKPNSTVDGKTPVTLLAYTYGKGARVDVGVSEFGEPVLVQWYAGYNRIVYAAETFEQLFETLKEEETNGEEDED